MADAAFAPMLPAGPAASSTARDREATNSETMPPSPSSCSVPPDADRPSVAMLEHSALSPHGLSSEELQYNDKAVLVAELLCSFFLEWPDAPEAVRVLEALGGVRWLMQVMDSR